MLRQRSMMGFMIPERPESWHLFLGPWTGGPCRCRIRRVGESVVAQEIMIRVRGLARRKGVRTQKNLPDGPFHPTAVFL